MFTDLKLMSIHVTLFTCDSESRLLFINEQASRLLPLASGGAETAFSKLWRRFQHQLIAKKRI